jgi:hypothetical protein
MYSIRKSEFIRFSGTNSTVSVIRAEIFCDTAADLPAYDAVSGTELYMGSIAYDIATGEMYVMNSSHEWKNSNGEASSAKSMSLRSPSLQKGQKIEVEQPEEKELEILETEGEEKGVEDDELIRDPEGE